MANGNLNNDHVAEKQALLAAVKRREQSLQVLKRELHEIERALASLRAREQQIVLLGDVCQSLERLDSAGGSQLLWKGEGTAEVLRAARGQIDEHRNAVQRAESRRDKLLANIRDQGDDLESLRVELFEAAEREQRRANQWVIERNPGEVPAQDTVMPWARSSSEDRRYRWSLVFTVIAAGGLAYAVSLISVPAKERPKQLQLPERMARLVREEREPPPPPKPIEEPVEEEEIPEPEPELADEQAPTDEPEPETEVAVLSEQEVKEKVKTQGILAFRESFAKRANLNTTVQLGSQARVRAVDDDAISRPQRSMVTSNAPGLESGINLADISRDVPEESVVASVEVARVASTIETDGTFERPQVSAARAGRTDEDIQIVFDRYKSALYRLYNRELRRDPRLRGQMVLKLTIEADGSVSSCELQSSNMNAPQLAQLVIVTRMLCTKRISAKVLSSELLLKFVIFEPPCQLTRLPSFISVSGVASQTIWPASVSSSI
jgi:outer membrane biosynthesis protein TonB